MEQIERLRECLDRRSYADISCQHLSCWPCKNNSQLRDLGVPAKPWELQKAVPFVFLLSNREAFPHSYDTPHEMTISGLGHEGEFENTLFRNASQTKWYYVFDEAVYSTHIHTERIRLIFTFTSMRRSHVYTWYNKTFCKPNNSRKHVAQQYKSKLIYKCKKYGRWKTVVGWPLLKSLDQLTTCAVLYTLPTANSRILLQSHAFWLLSNLVVIHDRTQSVLFPGTSIRVAAGPYKQAVLMLWFDFSDCTSSTSCCHRLHMLHCNDMSGLCWHQLHLSLLVLEVLQLENLLICNADKS